jgi:hypothetical protein
MMSSVDKTDVKISVRAGSSVLVLTADEARSLYSQLAAIFSPPAYKFNYETGEITNG